MKHSQTNMLLDLEFGQSIPQTIWFICNISLGSASEDAALNASPEPLGIPPAFQPGVWEHGNSAHHMRWLLLVCPCHPPWQREFAAVSSYHELQELHPNHAPSYLAKTSQIASRSGCQPWLWSKRAGNRKSLEHQWGHENMIFFWSQKPIDIPRLLNKNTFHPDQW